jgi:hypothetical protein
MNNLVCKSKSAALSTLDTIAGNMEAGIQKTAIAAVRDWLVENMPKEFGPDIAKRLEAVFEGTEEQQKGRAWLEREMSDPVYRGSTEGNLHHHHRKMLREPENGAELECFWNAKYKAWDPCYGWPDVTHKTNGTAGEEI